MIEMKNMAVAFNVPVIVLTQLNRNLEKERINFHYYAITDILDV